MALRKSIQCEPSTESLAKRPKARTDEENFIASFQSESADEVSKFYCSIIVPYNHAVDDLLFYALIFIRHLQLALAIRRSSTLPP
jgi:hypothetical protein